MNWFQVSVTAASVVGASLTASNFASCGSVSSSWENGTVNYTKEMKAVLQQCGEDMYQLLNLEYYQRDLESDSTPILSVKHDFLLIKVKKAKAIIPLYIQAEKLGSFGSFKKNAPAGPEGSPQEATGISLAILGEDEGSLQEATTGISLAILEEDKRPKYPPIHEVKINKEITLNNLIDVLTDYSNDYNLILENCWKYASSCARTLLMLLKMEEEAQKLVDAVNEVHNGELAHFFQSIFENISVMTKLNSMVAGKKVQCENEEI